MSHPSSTCPCSCLLNRADGRVRHSRDRGGGGGGGFQLAHDVVRKFANIYATLQVAAVKNHSHSVRPSVSRAERESLPRMDDWIDVIAVTRSHSTKNEDWQEICIKMQNQVTSNYSFITACIMIERRRRTI